MVKTKNNKMNFIRIAKKGYGKNLQNVKIYYTGSKPKSINQDGSFLFGKNILEYISSKFKYFKLILVTGKSKVNKQGKTYSIFLSVSDLKQMQATFIGRNRDVKQKIIANKFSEIFPTYFKDNIPLFSYEKGLFKNILIKNFLPTRLSTEDREAFNNFIPIFIASGVAGKKASKVSKITAGIELKILKGIADELSKRIKSDKSESTWQDYLKKNILNIQQGYIEIVEKANIGILQTKFPDFLLVTHDGYLDILEIKTPFTQLLSEDTHRNNFYFSTEVSKAISQTENYLHEVYSLSDKIRSKIKDNYGIELSVVRPRGVIFAGNSEQFFKNKKMSDNFRLLSQSLKNITIVTYDELLVRLQNYISILATLK